MQTPDSQDVIKRFFDAIYYLKTENIIKGKKTFAELHGIDRRNLSKLERDTSRDIFQTAWLSYLVKDYGVSARWLLTGQGNMIAKN